ncbi:trehalase [candidate division KSB1 bacterium]|nr:alpha,alpha-trehalase [bacterium]NUM68073.1 trehalase [candidate division KSB1 bacterium]
MKKTQHNLLLTTCHILLALCPLPHAFGQQPANKVSINIRTTLEALIADEDTDGDKKITIDDAHIASTERGDKRFRMQTTDRREFEVSGTYHLSNLLQELKLAEAAPDENAQLAAARIFEPPVDRLSRSIKELFWDGLTRRVDEAGLQTILSDEKTNTSDGRRYVYVPASDQTAFDYFAGVAQRHPEWQMKVVRLPRKISARYVRNLDGRHGILSLAIVPRQGGGYEGLPFVVPGGRFNEMYGWDSYFIALGLLRDGRVELAKAMVDNFVYEITHYGAILNANRTYYLTRSQPPFLTSMAWAVYQHLPKEAASKAWLKGVLAAAIQEYRNVWMNPDRLTKTGLSRYFDSGFGAPPEVEPGHFDVVFAAYARKHGMATRAFEAAYRAGRLNVPELDAYFVHDRAMRESGHDTSYRLEKRCADLVTVDLNSLLYKIERDIAKMVEEEFSGVLSFGKGRAERSADWRKAAEKRKILMNQYLWNAERGMFFDYDFAQNRQMNYESATIFYPLWAAVASKEQAESLVKNALPLLEKPGGLAGSTEASRGEITPDHPPRQWDYPNGWAPHQMLVWQGLSNYGYERLAQRLVYRWLYTITFNAANYNGTVPEKFDVATRSHQVFAEYGNVGTKFSYITREGFGWTNTSYQLGVSLLSQELRDSLNRLIPPEWVF